MQPKTINTLEDIANLSSDEFTRFLPDFIAWYELIREAKDVLGNDVIIGDGMEWFDDNEPGIVREIKIRGINKPCK